MTEYSRMAKGHFTSTGNAQVINLPFQPDAVEMWNYTLNAAAPAASKIVRAYWDVSMGQGQALVEGYSAGSVWVGDAVTTNGISTFAAGQLLQYGPIYQHTGSTDFSITAASPAVVTTTTNHGLATGNVVVFSNLYQTATTGMQQMAGVPLTVTVTGATTFSVNWNASGSNYTAFNTATSTGNVGSYKQVLYPYLYAPEASVITAINTSTNVITTAAAHNFQIGQEVGFHIPTQWGTTQLNELPNILIPGSPVYWYVIAVTQNTFTVSQSLSGFTAFNPNQTFASFPGLKFPMVVPVGDVNTGGVQISAGSPLYPSPNIFNGSGTTAVPTINGPAIIGSFVNNTSQGFIIGAGAGATTITSGVLVGASTNVIYWRAFFHDLAVN